MPRILTASKASGSGISSSSIPHSGSHRDSCSSALASSCVVPSFTSKSSTAVNLTPSSTSLPLPNPSIPDGDSVSFRRPLPPLPPPLRAEILRGMPLSSSPPSQPGELSPDPRSIPSTSNSSSFVSSPLFHGSQSSNLTTPLGSLKSPTLINDDHLDGPSNPLSPLVLRVPSNPNSSLLLEPIDLTASLHRAKLSASSSIYSAETLLTSNTPRSLLDIAVRDTERVLRRSADGTVEAGTLEGLVDRLLKETHDRARDDEVKRIFLATYRLFTTDENLFRILKRRFEESGVSDTPSPLGSIRYSCVLHTPSDADFTDALTKNFAVSANLAPGRWRKHGP
jgi:RasGEF N-terminal motif